MTEAERKICKYLKEHPQVSIMVGEHVYKRHLFTDWSDAFSSPRDVVTEQELADRVGVSIEDVRAYVQQAVSAWLQSRGRGQ